MHFDEVMDVLKRKEKLKQSNMDLVRELKRRNLPLVMNGAGEMAARIVDFLARNDIRVDLIYVTVDVENPVYLGIPVVRAEEVVQKYEQFDLIVGQIRYNAENDLKYFAPRKPNLYRFNCDEILFPNNPNKYGIVSCRYIEENKAAFRWTYERLADEKSKQCYVAYLITKITGKFPEEYYGCVESDLYFLRDLIQTDDDEVFFDCGAYDGDTVAQFVDYQKGKYKYIYATEPDSLSFRKLAALQERFGNMRCINKGVWHEAATLKFTNDGTEYSTVNGGGSTVIECDTIDNILEGHPCSFIKMDIEGAELNALRGAERTIRNCRPKLAVCAYHKADDLITIPQYISSLDSEYQFYFRCHRYYYSHDAVLYAVAPSRIRGLSK